MYITGFIVNQQQALFSAVQNPSFGRSILRIRSHNQSNAQSNAQPTQKFLVLARHATDAIAPIDIAAKSLGMSS